MFHKKKFIKMLLLFSVFHISCGILNADKTEEDKIWSDLFNDLIIVEGKVVNSQIEGRELSLSITIDHVFCGQRDIKGELFNDSVVVYDKEKRSLDWRKDLVGKKGIWSLRMYEGKPSVFRSENFDRPDYLDSIFKIMRGPITDFYGHEYSKNIGICRMMEKLCQANQNKRISLLKDYVSSEIPEISYLAIHLINDLKPTSYIEFFNETLDKDVQIYGIIAIDEVFSKIQSDEWNKSTKRLALYRKIILDIESEQDATFVSSRMHWANQNHEINGDMFFEISKIFIINKNIPVELRRLKSLSLLRDVKKNKEIINKVIDFLIQRLSEDDNNSIKEASAIGLKSAEALTPTQRNKIEALRNETSNQEIKKHLSDALGN